ncbi:GntR family transcriptional regulator [Amphibacillus sp. Q70]|uniref:GntR family transcriptional regulator n=1 Tax=Amphibacillus sp. Q70 TaxID=3453416 RepID=UPI003F85681E
MEGNLPLYVQLKNYLLRHIEGNLKPNEQIPSENSLIEMFNVSRTTVRKALDELTAEGVLYKKQGIGTFVKFIKNNHKLGDYTGFTQKMKKMGCEIQYNLISKEVMNANNAIASRLKLNQDEKVFHIERIGIRDGVPLNLTYSYIPYEKVKGIEDYDFAKASLYQVLKKVFNIEIVRTTKDIEAIATDYNIAKKLEIAEGWPVLRFNGYVHGISGCSEEFPIEYFRTYYRTDNTKFYIEENVNRQS